MEALPVLRLRVSPRGRKNVAIPYAEDGEFSLPTPYASAPSSPRRAFEKEVEEAPLGEVRAAVPFIWELVPGIPKNNLGISLVDVGHVSSDETEATEYQDRGSSSSSGESETTESLSRGSSNTEFEFSSRFQGIVEPPPWRAPPMSTAEELFSNGHLLPLRLPLPPRLLAEKPLRNSDSPCSDVSSSSSFKSYHSPQSPRSPRSLSLCRFTKTLDEDTTILGTKGGKQELRSHTPLLPFNRECPSSGNNLSPETNFCNDSVSFVSSSSASSGVEANRNSAEKLWPKKKDSTLKDLLFIDMAMASAEIEKSTLRSSKFRIAESRSDTMKTDQPPRNEFVGASGEIRAGPCGKSVVTPQLSRSNARSRWVPTLSPSISTPLFIFAVLSCCGWSSYCWEKYGHSRRIEGDLWWISGRLQFKLFKWSPWARST